VTTHRHHHGRHHYHHHHHQQQPHQHCIAVTDRRVNNQRKSHGKRFEILYNVKNRKRVSVTTRKRAGVAPVSIEGGRSPN